MKYIEHLNFKVRKKEEKTRKAVKKHTKQRKIHRYIILVSSEEKEEERGGGEGERDKSKRIRATTLQHLFSPWA